MVFCYEIVTSYRLVKKANARSGMKHLVTTDIVMMTLVSVMMTLVSVMIFEALVPVTNRSNKGLVLFLS